LLVAPGKVLPEKAAFARRGGKSRGKQDYPEIRSTFQWDKIQFLAARNRFCSIARRAGLYAYDAASGKISAIRRQRPIARGLTCVACSSCHDAMGSKKTSKVDPY
jgi:hypothetical protein